LELHVPSLLLTTAARKSGEKLFPLFYSTTSLTLSRMSESMAP
jgi:hypothetical protein